MTFRTRQHTTVVESGDSAPPLVPRLRVISVVYAPSNAEVNQRLRSLALGLRGSGHALLAAVPVGSLLPEDAAAADASGIEYVFAVPPSRVSRGAVARWRLVLRRFQPTIIHVGADVPPAVALGLARATSRTIGPRPAIILELPQAHGSQPAIGGKGLLDRRLRTYVTQVIHAGSRADVPWDVRSDVGVERITPLPPMGSRAETTHSAPTLAILCDTRAESGALAMSQALNPLLLAHESLRIVVVGSSKAPGRYLALDQWPEEVRPRVAITKSIDEWLRYATDAVGVLVSPVGPISPRMLGAVLALGLPLVAADDVLARLGTVPLSCARAFRRDSPAALARAVNELLSAAGEDSRPAWGLDHDAEARRLMSIFAGVALREWTGARVLSSF